jgi:hypothetical protein
MSQELRAISGCGKTEDECRTYYGQQKRCPAFAILDTDASDLYESSNCVHYSNWLDQLVEEFDKQHGQDDFWQGKR